MKVPSNPTQREQWLQAVAQAIADDIIAGVGPLDEGDGAIVQQAVIIAAEQFVRRMAEATGIACANYFHKARKV